MSERSLIEKLVEFNETPEGKEALAKVAKLMQNLDNPEFTLEDDWDLAPPENTKSRRALLKEGSIEEDMWLRHYEQNLKTSSMRDAADIADEVVKQYLDRRI